MWNISKGLDVVMIVFEGCSSSQLHKHYIHDPSWTWRPRCQWYASSSWECASSSYPHVLASNARASTLKLFLEDIRQAVVLRRNLPYTNRLFDTLRGLEICQIHKHKATIFSKYHNHVQIAKHWDRHLVESKGFNKHHFIHVLRLQLYLGPVPCFYLCQRTWCDF